MSTAAAVIGHNISKYLSPSALKVAISVLTYVSETQHRFAHGLIMRFDGRILKRIITLLSGNDTQTVIGFTKSLKVKLKQKNIAI